MKKLKVLFICVHNSARSQMAEAFLNDVCGAEFEAQSAGLEPGTCIRSRESDARIRHRHSKNRRMRSSVSSLVSLFPTSSRVQEAEARLPDFPGPPNGHWPFARPSKVEGRPGKA